MVNSIVVEALIDALYRASNSGVKVEVWVRGICSLRPGIPGLSENIIVRSVVGRYLEHSRIFSFVNNGDTQTYIGSADMMHRNLDRRVEALVRLTDPAHVKEIDSQFEVAMDAGTSSWHLDGDGGWTRHTTDDEGLPLVDLQAGRMVNIGQRSTRSGHRR